MPYSTVVAGTTITASWSNANNRDQVVTPFASTGARDAAIVSPINGMMATTTDTGSLWRYNGTAWVQWGTDGNAGFTSWTPTIAQGASANIAKTIGYARYWRIGGLCYFWVNMLITGSGTSGSAITMSLPLTAVSLVTAGDNFGSAMYYQAGPRWCGQWEIVSSTTVAVSGANGNSGLAGVVANAGGASAFAAANGDALRGSGFYPVN